MGHRALGTAALPILSLSPASRCLMPPWSAAKVESRTSALAGHHGGLADVELLCGPATLARTLKKTDGFNGNRQSLDWNMCFRPSPRD
jgi:hypothetical protein